MTGHKIDGLPQWKAMLKFELGPMSGILLFDGILDSWLLLTNSPRDYINAYQQRPYRQHKCCINNKNDFISWIICCVQIGWYIY